MIWKQTNIGDKDQRYMERVRLSWIRSQTIEHRDVEKDSKWGPLVVSAGQEEKKEWDVLNWELLDKMEISNNCIWKGNMETGQGYCQQWKIVMTKRVEGQRTNWSEESRRDWVGGKLCAAWSALSSGAGDRPGVHLSSPLASLCKIACFCPRGCWQHSSGSPVSASSVLPLSGKTGC